MSDCWKCDNQLPGYGNYCTSCGAPQNPKMAVQSFYESAKNFKTGIDGLLDLIDDCQDMLIEGLTEDEDTSDVRAAEWERRFENSFLWLHAYFYRLWLTHYDIPENKLKQFLDEHQEEIETEEVDTEAIPTPANETCSCGAVMSTNPPSVITRWNDAMETAAVCFECFGDVNAIIEVSD